MPKTREKVALSFEAREKLKTGADIMGRVLRVTLGPAARTVAIAPLVKSRAPEVLHDGATIARRIIEIPNRYENAGAMMIRHMAWRVREEVGDGAATTAVVAQTILHEAHRRVAAGANPMMLKRGIERALEVAVKELRAMAKPLESEEQIAAIATASAGDPRMGKLIGEMLSIIGHDGVILVEESAATFMDREYVEGMRWNTGYVSPYFVTDTDRMEAVVNNPWILVTDTNLESLEDVQPILEKVLKARQEMGIPKNEGGLVIIANEIEKDALATLTVNKERGVMPILGIKAPGYGDNRVRILEDIALLTGAKFISEDAGERVYNATLEHLGKARRVWANKDTFTIIGGQADQAAIRARVLEIKNQLKGVGTKEKLSDYDREKLRERLGKLTGGIAILRIGAPTERELQEKKQRAEEAVAATQAAVEEGVVPGGGAAYLACIPTVLAIEAEGDERMGVEIMARALEAPAYWIAWNAGADARAVVAEAKRLGPGYAYEVRSDRVMRMEDAGILDPLKVVRVALETGTSGGLMMLTTEAIVLTKRDKSGFTNVSLNP